MAKKIILVLLFFYSYAIAAQSAVSLASLDQEIGQMIMIGFHGTDPKDSEVKLVAKQIQQGQIGGVILFSYNIKNPSQLKKLMNYIKSQTPQETSATKASRGDHDFNLRAHYKIPLFIAVDQEGGKVQRLSSKNGFDDFPSAKTVGNLTLSQAENIYQAMAVMLDKAGFNFVFGPVVDLDYDSPSAVIGGLERSYSKDPKKVVQYAKIYIKAMHAQHILTALKHFPGHGSARGDTHNNLTDITKTWSKTELIPYENLIRSNQVDAVMTAHLINQSLDPNYPATLSKIILNHYLIKLWQFNNIIISDDLHMGAILKNYGLREAIIRSIKAGINILIFSNNPAAAKGVDNFTPDPNLPDKIIAIIKQAVKTGEISREAIHQSYLKIIKLKQKI